MVNPPALVHRLQSWSMKDLVHLLLPRVRFTCTKCMDVWLARENPHLLPRRAPAGGELTGEPLGRYWCAIRVGNSLALPWRVPR